MWTKFLNTCRSGEKWSRANYFDILKCLILAIGLPIAVLAQPSEGIGWPKLVEKVDNFVKKTMSDSGIVGMTVAVSKEGRLVLSKGYGYAKSKILPKGGFEFAPMKRDHRSRIGSVSKAAITGPTAYQLLREKGINPVEQKLYGDGGVFGHRFDADQKIGTNRYFPAVGMAISPEDKVYTWYVNGRYTVGTSRELDKFQPPQLFRLPPDYLPIDVRGIAITSGNRVIVWYHDGTWSEGEPDDWKKHKAPNKKKKVKLPGGKSMWDVVGIAIAKSTNRVYVWYDDGSVSCGSKSDFTKYFVNRKYHTPSENLGSMSCYDIRGIGISKNDRVYVWYSNGMLSIGTSNNFTAYRSPTPYQLPDENVLQPGSRDKWWNSITLQQVLNHTAGFRGSGDTKATARMFGIPEDQLSYEQVHRHFLRTRPLRTFPGKEFLYSNHGFGLWTLIIPELSGGQSYVSRATEHFLAPIGLVGKVRPMSAHPDYLDADGYNLVDDKPVRVTPKDTGLGLAAGGWTASAQELLWITRHLTDTYTAGQIDSLGWFRRMSGRLEHNGKISGGAAYVTIFPDNFTTNDGLDLSNIHIAVASNTQISPGVLTALADKIAREVPKAGIPANYNIWGGFAEYARQGIPAEVFGLTFEHGYKPVWIDAYNVNGKTYFNSIFRPDDGVPWVAKYGLTAAQYQNEFDRLTPRGFRPLHIESYADGNQVRYAVIFEKRKGGAWRAYHGKSPDEHQQLFNSLTAQGYQPVNISVTYLNGKTYFAALYEKNHSGSFVALSAIPLDKYQHYFDDNRKAGRQLTYLNAWEKNGKVYFSAIWRAGIKAVYNARHNLTEKQYQTLREQQLEKGLLTEFVTGYVVKGQHTFAALWRKKNQTKPKSIGTVRQ
jgi:CubicO group peptidase (beta-lactamase class C family)